MLKPRVTAEPLPTFPSQHQKELIRNYCESSLTGTLEDPDVRCVFCAVATLYLLGRRPEDSSFVDLRQRVVSFAMQCQNKDGGFGSSEGNESHAGHTFCAIGILHTLDGLEDLPQRNRRRLERWLLERQLSRGGTDGINGRPGKEPDVCYSWWVVASLSMLGVSVPEGLLCPSALVTSILDCQDSQFGGFSRSTFDSTDPYHTFFALAALSLISNGKWPRDPPPPFESILLPIHSTYAIPLRHLSSRALPL